LQEALPLPLGQPVLRYAVFSADGSRLFCCAHDPAASGPERVFSLWEVPAGKLLARQAVRAPAYRSASLAPDGRRVAYLSEAPGGDGEIRLWDTTTGEDRHLAGGVTHPDCRLQFSADGSLFAVACQGSGKTGTPWVEIRDARTGQRVSKLADLQGRAGELAF